MSIYPIERSANKSVCRLLVVTLMLLAATGCHRDDVKVYRIAKEQDQASQPAAPALPTDSPNPKLPQGHPDVSTMPGATLAASASAAPQLTWKTPADWKEAPPSELRVASFKVAGKDGKQADVSVIPLLGMAGTDAANVNRWRGQIGLPAMTDAELQKSAESIEAGGQPAQLYDITGQNPASGETSRILGVIQHRDNTAWFYKMTGDAGLVEQQKPAFIEFLKSVNFGTAAQAQTEMPAAHPAIGGDMMGSAATAGPISHEGQPTWQVPAGWQEVPAGQFLVAKFTLTGDGGAMAAVNVSMSAGGLAANVNRWRGQLGLAPLSEDDVNKSSNVIDVQGGKASLVTISGTDPQTGKPARLVGVMVSQAGQTWFYKLMGDEKLVTSQKDAFIQFVQGVKY